jgi:hypothetical protein
LQWRELNIDVNLVKVPKSIGKLKHIEKFAPHWNNLRWALVDLETLLDEFCHMQF